MERVSIKKALVFMLAFILIPAVAVGTLFWFLVILPTEEAAYQAEQLSYEEFGRTEDGGVITSFIRTINDANYEEAYLLVSEDVRLKEDYEDFVVYLENMKERNIKIVEARLANSKDMEAAEIYELNVDDDERLFRVRVVNRDNEAKRGLLYITTVDELGTPKIEDIAFLGFVEETEE